MKNNENTVPVKLNSLTVRLITAGSILVLGLLTVSAVTYFGAGKYFDYPTALILSAKLLSYVRPSAVLSCAGIIAAEYMLRSKKGE